MSALRLRNVWGCRRPLVGMCRCALLAIVAECLIVGLPAPGAAAQDLPAQMSVTVVAPSGTHGPAPTGDITVSLDGDKIATVPLTGATNPLTTATPLLSAGLHLVGKQLTIAYSGDSNYEASDGVTVTFPSQTGVTITPKLRKGDPPVVDIVSPRDGERYKRGASVFALYSCRPSDIRSPVARCDGPVPPGIPVNTSSAGSFTFSVRAEDVFGRASTKSVAYTVGNAAAAAAAAAAPPPPPPAPAGEATPPPAAAPAPKAAVALIAAATKARAAKPSPKRPRSSAAAGASVSSAARPAPRAESKRAAQEYAPYDPRSEPVKSVGILVAAFTLMQLAGAGRGLARGGGTGGGGGASGGAGRDGAESNNAGGDGDSSSSSPSMDYEGVDIAYLGTGMSAVAVGDFSRTWAWPGTRIIDALGVSIPARLARRSPLLARLSADSTYLRAIFGSASVLTMAAGLALGVLALQDTGGEAIPPAAILTIAIAMLGVLDAAAGLAAVLVFMFGTLARGGLDSDADLRLLLGLSALWCVVPILAGAVRPLRRSRATHLEQWWDRAADFVIASLIGAWAVQKIIISLPGLAGVTLPITDHANTAAYCVLAAMLARLGFETLAAQLYPKRLARTEPELPDPDSLQRLAACGVRAAIFVFFAYIVVGSSWQLWVGAALFVIPQVLGVYEDRFPNSAALYRVLPKGLVELVLMLFVATAVGALLLDLMNENATTFLANCFVLMSLPGFVLSLAQLFAREGDEPKIGWGKRWGGVVLLSLGTMLALGMLL